MEEKQLRNCENCGAKLDRADDKQLQCFYCGTVYEIEKEEAVKTPKDAPSQNVNAVNNTAATPANSESIGCGVLF